MPSLKQIVPSLSFEDLPPERSDTFAVHGLMDDPVGEKIVTLELPEQTVDVRKTCLPSRSGGSPMKLAAPSKTSITTATKPEGSNLYVRSSWCFWSTFAGPDGRADYATEEAFAQVKYRQFLGAFMQTSFLMPLGAFGQAIFAMFDEYWARAAILGGIVAPMYFLYGFFVWRWEKHYLRLNGTIMEKVLIASLSFQSVAIVIAEYLRSQLDYGMLVMHMGFVHNFSPLGEIPIHMATGGFGLLPYVLLKVHRIFQASSPDPEIPLVEGVVFNDTRFCKTVSLEATQLLEIVAPSVILLYQSVVTMRKFRSMRLDFLIGCMLNKQRTQLKNERQKCEGLLTSMLPKKIIGSLKANESIEPQSFNDVTVVFIQVCDFQGLCSNFCAAPEAVVEVLNILYLEFDRLSDVLDVYKVETVCDVYMAVVGCPQPIVNHADVAAHFALAVQESMKHLRNRINAIELEMSVEGVQSVGDGSHTGAASATGSETASRSPKQPLCKMPQSLREYFATKELQVRIGLHSGRVRAGVVGLECPRYKLVGDTVNTASRMESTCNPGQIQMSETTREKLSRSQFSLESRGEISVKGKGMMNTYYLLSYADGGGMKDRRILIEHGRAVDDEHENAEYGSEGECAVQKASSMRAPQRTTGRWREEFARYGVLNMSDMPVDTAVGARHSCPAATPEEDLSRCSWFNWEKLNTLFLLLPPSEKTPAWMKTLRRDKHRFKEDTLEKRIASARNLTIIWLMILATVSMIDIFLDLLEEKVQDYRTAILLRAIGNYLSGLAYLLLITNQNLFRRHAQFLTLSMLAVQGVALLGCSFIVYDSDLAVIVLYGAYVLFYKVITIRARLGLCVFAVLAYIGLMLYSCEEALRTPQELVRNVAFLLIFFLFMACGVRLEEHLEHVAHYEQRRTQLRLQEIDRARAASSGLLESLLPRHVVDLVAEGVSPIAEYYDGVTIMFTDIKGFTAMSAHMLPQELVDLLNSIYSAFDEIIVNWGVYKVEIIGDAYFVSAGCPPSPATADVQPDEWAMRALEVALALQRALARVTEDDSLTMRVGLHSGSVVAGVVGKKGPRYHLFGAAVGYAEHMESSGEPGKVQISDATYNLLIEGGHEYTFQERQVELDGAPEQHHRTWLVGNRKNRVAVKLQKEMIAQRRRSCVPTPGTPSFEGGSHDMLRYCSM